jgi:hypothetical protein
MSRSPIPTEKEGQWAALIARFNPAMNATQAVPRFRRVHTGEATK